LSRTHDVRPLVVTTLLTYLELADIIEATAPFYTEYQFEPLKTLAQITARFDAERAAFLKELFAHAVKAQKWYRIDLRATADRLHTTRERLAKTFTYLEETGDLTLKVGGLRLGYRIKTQPADRAALIRTLVEKFEARERNDIGRVQQVLALVTHSGCLVRRLLHHFGEELGRDCGHCGPCRGESSRELSRRPETVRPCFDRAQVLAMHRTYRHALGTARQTARFLCGLSSPRLTQSKLNKDDLFGSCANIPFQTVMTTVAELYAASS
jgi:ATP-dependent DNA helicase RecQ